MNSAPQLKRFIHAGFVREMILLDRPNDIARAQIHDTAIREMMDVDKAASPDAT